MASEPHSPKCIFLSWSGESSKAMGTALNQLVRTTFGGRVATWQSSRDLRGSDWRRGIRTAVNGSQVAILLLAPGTLSSMWLMYEAGAFFHEDGKVGPNGAPMDTVFVIGCGVDAAALRNTPLNALNLWDAQDESQVRAMLESVAATIGDTGSDFAASFSRGWSGYATAMAGIRAEIEATGRAQAQAAVARQEADAASAARASRRKRRLAAVAASAIALVGGAPWVWAFWPDPPEAPPCTVGTARDRTDCRWEDYLKQQARDGPKANRNLPTQMSRRPFAVVALAPSCDDHAAVTRVRLVTQHAKGPGWTFPVVFAKSSSDTGDGSSAIALDTGAGLQILKVDECAAVGDTAIRVRFIGTLSNDRICKKLSEVREAFKDSPGFEEQIAEYWSKHGLGTRSELEPTVRTWVQQCGT
jgi:hypothetical protein